MNIFSIKLCARRTRDQDWNDPRNYIVIANHRYTVPIVNYEIKRFIAVACCIAIYGNRSWLVSSTSTMSVVASVIRAVFSTTIEVVFAKFPRAAMALPNPYTKTP